MILDDTERELTAEWFEQMAQQLRRPADDAPSVETLHKQLSIVLLGLGVLIEEGE